MGCVTIWVTEQEEVYMVLSANFRAKILNTKPFGIIDWREDIDTDSGVLFLEHWNMLCLHGKVDTVKVESVLVLGIVRNLMGVNLDRIQT